nr:hypothetical protein [Tanacetum cinerariifolium]
MSSMEELTFFLGLQVKQKDDGIFISQDKSMIGSLMYLTAFRPDIMFVVYACARDSPFDLEAFSNSDYARASLDRKSTTGESDGFEQMVNFLNASPIKYKKHKPRRKQREATEVPHTEPQAEERVPIPSNDPLSSEESQKTREKEKSRTSGLNRLYKIGLSAKIVSLDEKGLGAQEDASKHRRSIADINQDERTRLVDDTQGRINDQDLFEVQFPRFVQVFVNHQLGDMSHQKGIFINLSLTKKVFANMKRIGIVDEKKVIMNEASIRRDLRLDDTEGTACLPNDAIFEELARMSTMASAIISLANNHKFNLSKYILDNMVKNLEVGVKFYMFPRFVQVFVNHQLGDMSHQKGIFINLSLTKKKKHKPRRKQREATEVPHTEPQAEERVPIPSNDPLSSEESQKTREKEKSRTSGLNRLYKIGLSAKIVSLDEKGLGAQEDASKHRRSIADINQDERTRLVDDTQGRINDQDLFEVHDLDGDEVFVDVTTEPEKPLKKKDQIALDEEVARKLEAKMKARMDEEERIAREKNEANIAMIE